MDRDGLVLIGLGDEFDDWGIFDSFMVWGLMIGGIRLVDVFVRKSVLFKAGFGFFLSKIFLYVMEFHTEIVCFLV